jgi:hypothetical protein
MDERKIKVSDVVPGNGHMPTENGHCQKKAAVRNSCMAQTRNKK